jgi:hypothetical protein
MTREHIIWAMASGEVRYSTSLRDCEGVPKLALVDVESLARRLPTAELRGKSPRSPNGAPKTPTSGPDD